MWRPPNIVKHTAPEGGWPSRNEAKESLLFSPIRLGPLQLENRTWVPAMVPWRATGDGEITDDNLDWYGRFAQGQPGVIVVEATGVRDLASGPLIRIGHDRYIPGLARLVERVREASSGKTRLLIQIIDFLALRRRPPKETFFRRYLELTERHRHALAGTATTEEEIRELLIEMPEDELTEILTEREFEALEFGFRERVTDVDKPHIAELPAVLPEVFAAAAYRAEQAGFDGVELHYAHAYTMASFLSAKNTRTDGYGGPPEKRVRLPLEVFEAVRAAVGRDFTVGCRFLSEECIEGGSSLEDAIVFGLSFARAGMDFLSLSRGGKFEDAKQPKVGSAVYPYTGRSGYECMPTVRSDEKGPFGRNVPYSAAIRRALRAAGFETPVIAAGGICSFEQAESILLAGEADIIGAARQSLADPDWFLKMRLGRGEEIRRCKFTNYCEALDQKHKKVTCQLWDRVDRDQPGVTLSEDGRRRLIAPDWSRDS